MIDRLPSTPSSSSATGLLVPSAALRAYLALVAALGGGVTALLLMLSVATNAGSEAERIAETQDDGYALTLVSALAINLSKPLR